MQGPGVAGGEDYVIYILYKASVFEMDSSGAVFAVDIGDCGTALDVGVLECVVREVWAIYY